MQPVFRYCAVVFLVLSCAGLFAQTARVESESAAASELEAVSRGRFKDFVARNTGSFAALYAPDFWVVGNDGKVEGIGLLTDMLREAPKDMAIEPYDYRVMLSEDRSQGVVFHKTHDTWNGEKSEVAYTEVYTRKGGHWVINFEHYTNLTPAK